MEFVGLFLIYAQPTKHLERIAELLQAGTLNTIAIQLALLTSPQRPQE